VLVEDDLRAGERNSTGMGRGRNGVLNREKYFIYLFYIRTRTHPPYRAVESASSSPLVGVGRGANIRLFA
jgi:hypothetical protein